MLVAPLLRHLDYQTLRCTFLHRIVLSSQARLPVRKGGDVSLCFRSTCSNCLPIPLLPASKGYKAWWVRTSQQSACLSKWTPGATDALDLFGRYLFFCPMHTYLPMPPRISQSHHQLGAHRGA